MQNVLNRYYSFTGNTLQIHSGLQQEEQHWFRAEIMLIEMSRQVVSPGFVITRERAAFGNLQSDHSNT